MPYRRPRPARVAALAIFLFSSLLYVRDASAQASITVVNERSLPRTNPRGETVPKRPLQLNPEGVSLQDCLEDVRIQFTLQMAGFEPQAVIQVWGSNTGVDCSQPTLRSGGTQQCWRVAPDIPLQTLVSVNIPVRTIMSGVTPFTPIEPVSNESVCGQVDLANLQVHFLYFSPGNLNAPTSSKVVTVQVDTVGPSAPSGIDTLPGNQRIQVRWQNISGEGGVTALTGVNVYCDPAGTSAPQVVQNDASCTEVPNEAGPAEDAGEDAEAGPVDAGTTTVCEDGGTTTRPASAECSSQNLEQPVQEDGGVSSAFVPDKAFNDKFLCGAAAGNVGTSVIAERLRGQPLQNLTTYAVAVAATDQFGNVGPLSRIYCEVPDETTDFWDSYRTAGGQAGGGICSTTGPGVPVGSATVLGMILAVAASTVRRKWKDSR